jgi:hypothetical protein
MIKEEKSLMKKLVWKEDLRFSQWYLGGLESPET